ncbi:MAG: rhodanese-like domain-containing protein [Edaphobacter sp.]|uniref:rhodanese-like domain-containing protein n=1 Tax=Edaphobacter sp. TaxID=1934404 RepID=UPI00238284F4|nr:rhodanese-like domain-containing protein [Edaphobacter sp.]MDE1175468.1 rhodanese-like domain-containing protein [Edaphobacter sp.]
MLWVVVAVVLIAVVFGAVSAKRAKDAREYRENTIDADALRALLEQQASVKLFDVRQPLDLLAYSEMIPGALRLPPKQVEADPALIPRDTDVVLYCTCDGQKTSLEIVRKAKDLGYSRLKVLHGGLAAWKAKGYPVEVYREAFRLDTAV